MQNNRVGASEACLLSNQKRNIVTWLSEIIINSQHSIKAHSNIWDYKHINNVQENQMDGMFKLNKFLKIYIKIYK